MTEQMPDSSVEFRVGGTSYLVTRENIISAMAEYDNSQRKSTLDSGRNYVLIHNEKRFPPKRILALALGLGHTHFGGGEGKYGANKVLRLLGFTVQQIKAVGPHIRIANLAMQVPSDSRLLEPAPSVDVLVELLFSQPWKRLHDQLEAVTDRQYPGVYILARSTSDMSGKVVQESDVYYVGMSQTMLSARLGQFLRGLENGKHHSGAKRHFYDVNGGVPHRQLATAPSFFVVTVAVPCITQKGQRTALDLRKLGEVARLEYYVLARIKENTGAEPWLNRK
jgi:hypothetical protein